VVNAAGWDACATMRDSLVDWLGAQPIWTRALVSSVGVGVLLALFNTVFTPHAPVFIPTLIVMVIWGVSFTAYCLWSERGHPRP